MSSRENFPGFLVYVRTDLCSPYDIGTRKNFEQVFGTNPLLWFIPMNRENLSLDGTTWPTTSDSSISEEAKSLLDTAV